MKTHKKYMRMAIVFLAFHLCAPSAHSQEYQIGVGDVLSISVFEEEDLSLKEVRVNGAGAISLPLIGEIKARGLTSRQLEELITHLLLDGYLVKPKVTVAILHYRMFYVHGQVKKPGGYPYVEGLTVQKAIALAGGFTERASESKIQLVLEGRSKDKPEMVNISSTVDPGDVIIVGESLF